MIVYIYYRMNVKKMSGRGQLTELLNKRRRKFYAPRKLIWVNASCIIKWLGQPAYAIRFIMYVNNAFNIKLSICDDDQLCWKYSSVY